MNTEQLRRMRHDKGFIAALDQSGGSTPKALKLYGIAENSYSGDEAMFEAVHAMRTRIIKSPAFTAEYILGAILFEDTMNRSIDAALSADYLWNAKRIVPFLKVDKGLDVLSDGVQLMKPMPGLAGLLEEARKKNIFGTKMRSVIFEPNQTGIAHVVEQQFSVAQQICRAGLVPIIEPEVDIHSQGREDSEAMLLHEVQKQLKKLGDKDLVMFKFSIPVQDNLYATLLAEPQVVRVVALSGGYSLEEANEKLSRNKGVIASFSRALTEGLSAQQEEKDFDAALGKTIKSIYQASIS